MEQIRWVAVFIAVCCFIGSSAQDRKRADPAPRQAAGETGGARETGETNAADSGATMNMNKRGDRANARPENGSEEGTRSGNTTNVGALIQQTTSGSGSPAFLSGEDGAGRDGTNNVQRAGMNMAGSPVTRIKLNSETTDVKEKVGKRQQPVTRENSASAAAINNNNSRKRNNALSDKNPSAKKKKASGKGQKKSVRRSVNVKTKG